MNWLTDYYSRLSFTLTCTFNLLKPQTTNVWECVLCCNVLGYIILYINVVGCIFLYVNVLEMFIHMLQLAELSCNFKAALNNSSLLFILMTNVSCFFENYWSSMHAPMWHCPSFQGYLFWTVLPKCATFNLFWPSF